MSEWGARELGFRTRGRPAGWLAAWVVLWLCVPAGAGAQEADGGFAVDLYRPGAVLGRDILGVPTSDLLEHLRFSASVTFSYADDPLTMVDAIDRDLVLARFIDHRVGADVGLALGLFGRLELVLSLPVVLSQGGDDLAPLGRPGEVVGSAGVGDLGVRLALRVFGGREGFQLHLAGRVAVPVGDQAGFMSDGALRIEPSLGLGYASGGFRVALEAGYELREKRTAATYVGDDMVRWGLGVRLPVMGGSDDRLAVLLSAQGTIQTAKGVDPLEPSRTLKDDPSVSVELLGGLEWVTGPWALMAGGGASVVRAVGSPDVRAFVGVGWTSPAPEDTPDVPDEPPVKPVVSDRDGDGIPDDRDLCPDEPEDKDGFQDEDGCPDPDNDGDGIPDTVDRCPNEPEDKDGFQDEDGCPDLDNDGDGIPDAVDQCPNRPEVKNGIDDEDGCPDTDAQDLALGTNQIELLRPVLFVGDRVKPDSWPVLDQVAKLLIDHRYLTKVRVEAHTDSEGNDQVNLALTQRRAESVVAYLVSKGVAKERLVAQGFGESRPLMPNDRPERRAKNRRVELHLIEVDGKPLTAP